MGKGDTAVIVACDGVSPEIIHGWLVYTPPNILHFMYVKKSLRHHGLAMAMLKSQGIDLDQVNIVTHLTSALTDKGNKYQIPPGKPRALYGIFKNGTGKLIYDPYFLEVKE